MGQYLVLIQINDLLHQLAHLNSRRWRGKIVNDLSKIKITNLNPIKRPISAVADNHMRHANNNGKNK